MSVVVPAKDASGTIGAALGSAFGQIAPPGEVIVVDDGSSDSTAALAEAAGAKVIRREVSGGPSVARNEGIAEAKGDLVAFLDADDLWHPGKTERQLSLLDANPEAVAVATDWVRSEGQWASAPPEGVTSRFSYPDFLVMNQFQTSTVIARRSALEEIGGFRAELDGVEDWDCWLRLSKLGPIVKADWPYVLYRDSPGGVSKDLGAIYPVMVSMLSRERSEGLGSVDHGGEILAWHHMRFGLNWALDRDFVHAKMALSDLAKEGLMRHAPGAVLRYMIPFLLRRASRRFPVLAHPALAERIPVFGSGALGS